MDATRVDSAQNGSQIKVWDPFLRLFHWLLLLCCVGLYLSAYGGYREWHTWFGYSVVMLLSFRLLWGGVGSRHARFSDFLYHPRVVFGFLRSVLMGRPDRYLGHDPVGGLMVVSLLLTLLGMVISGLVVLATIEFQGPLLTLLITLSDQSAYVWLDFHSGVAVLLLWLIGLHVAGVLVIGRLTRQRLVRAMLTGFKQV